MNYLSLLFDPKESGTIILYTIIFFVVSFLGFKSQAKTEKGITCQFRFYPFIGSFLILWAFFAFNDVGIDTPHYRGYFDIYKSKYNIDDGFAAVEIWYQYLNVLLHYATNNAVYAVAIVRTLQLSIFFYAVYKCRTFLNVGLAIMAYVALYYYQSFDLLRSSLSGSLCLLSFVYLYDRKYIYASISVFLAFQFHHSAALYAAAICVYFVSTLLKKHTLLIQTIAIIGLIIVLYFGKDLISLFLMNDFGGGRYDSYSQNKESAIGLFVILKYLPVGYCLYLIKRNLHNDNELRWWNLCFVISIVGFAIAILGYTNGMLTRAAIYFSASFIFLLPESYKDASLYMRGQNITIFRILLILYFIFLFISNTGEIYEMDGIGPFKFI